MISRLVLPGDRVREAPSFPAPADLADVWLVHALTHLRNAYAVPDETSGKPRPSSEGARLERLDASRLALVSAALAVEARLNRLLRRCDPSEWRAVEHLGPAGKFRLAPRLLGGHDSASKHASLCDLVEEIFHVRDELVDAAGEPGAALNVMSSRFSPGHARAVVQASAKICCFLAALGDEDDNGTGELVLDAAHALGHRVDLPSEVEPPPSSPHWDWSWEDLDFPPDIVGS